MIRSATYLIGGMPTILPEEVTAFRHLTRWGMDRLDTISFFLMVMFVVALLVKLLWNSLGRDVTWMPRLTYLSAVGIVFLWSLAFVIVLTMISGARELMTPGAWEKDGYTYRIRQSGGEELPENARLLELRHEQLNRIFTDLTEYAGKHQGRFPPQLSEDGETEPRPPFRPDLRYEYRSPNQVEDPDVIVIEPSRAYAGPQLALTVNGKVLVMASE